MASKWKGYTKSRSTGRDANKPVHPNVSSGGAGRSINVPRPRFSNTNVMGVNQSLRRTLSWVSRNSFIVNTNYQEAAVTIVNSPYDPDAALGGVSAAGFAKYMALYSKCFCIAANYKVKFALAATSGSGVPTQTYVGATITTNTTGLGSTVAAIQAGMTDYKVLNQNPDSGTLNVGVDVAKFVDKPDILDDNQFFCTSGANPAQVIVAHLWTDTSAVTPATNIFWVIECEMDCIFTDPIPFT